ncbi:MAG TPA: alanine--tRNA ligase, partial [Acholeplasma sp.]|nr:alanine--tRNA ligase [Acholeplasma sp.]
MTSNEIRNTWLRFFKNHNHHVLESSSLVPVNDPTLLWINAGVAPLKKYFDGSEKPVSNRLTNVQKCIRTNDIENVGLTTRHHTFFEMLGNFSIGDYFKEEAINLAYELLFSKEYFNFPLDKIYITYYTNDLDAKKYWLNLGIKESHLVAMDDNYWEIGEGPSGPNTEIFFDRGIEYDKRGIELIKEDLDNDRFIEIWNIDFSQFNSKEGLKRSEYPELPNKNIDTGAGLERFACILQNSKTNFETDLFMPIINETEKLSGVKYEGQMAFKVIADHIKTLVFAINDGATLSNEGRGYVLRRLLRRALKFGRNINLNKPFLYLLIDSVITTMGGFYKDISKNKEIISKIILSEEEQFLKTLNEGEKHFFDSIKNTNKIDGKTAFKLYDTYGFPIELTLEYAKDNNVLVDIDGFNEELLIQKERSRSAREKVDSMKSQDEAYLNFNEKSIFVGYDIFETNSKVIKIFDNGIVLDKTPFYATSGGQVADLGTINNIEVEDVVKLPNGQNLHVLDTKDFKQGDLVVAKIDINNRSEVMKNHSATHLLHQALKDVLGSHVNQQGSLVNSEYLRFDFNNFENLTNNEILEIEKIVNSKIKEGLNVNISEMKIDDAKKLGAMALFSEKYG